MKILHGHFRTRVLNEKKKKHRRSQGYLTGRQIACLIYEHLKISDTDGTVLDTCDLVKNELRSDNVQIFDTKWDEAIITVQKQPDEELFVFEGAREI